MASFSYGTAADGAYALKDIDLSVEEGTFVGLIGPGAPESRRWQARSAGAIPTIMGALPWPFTLVAGLDTCEVSLTDIAKVSRLSPPSYQTLRWWPPCMKDAVVWP